MDDHSLVAGIVLGIVCGFTGSFMHSFSLWRSYRRMNLRIVDLEGAQLQLRNRGYAEKRWRNSEQLEAELGALKGTEKKAARFANDPPEF